MKETKRLIDIIRFVIESDSDPLEFEDLDWIKLIKVAKKNEVFSYVYRYMKQLHGEKLPSVDIIKCMDTLDASEISMSVLQECAVDTLREGLEKAGIDHMFMKGTVTRKRYPDVYLRSMGDIDFLYRSDQHDALCEAMKKLGFVQKSIGRVHDIYTDDSNVLVEAHRQMLASSSPYSKFCDDIWFRASQDEKYKHEYSMRIEDEFLFNFIHLASHFEKGGIGIRFIVDFWIYKQSKMDWKYIRSQLKKLNLSLFYDSIEDLAEKWFGHKCQTGATIDEIENYIFSGGIFGNSDNRQNAAIRDGKVKYFFKVCFPNYDEMRSMFPWLNTRIMLPYAWIRRIVESLIKRRRNVRKLLTPLSKDNTDSVKEMKSFFIRCGLE